MGQLPAEEGGQPAEGVQQPLVSLGLLWGGGQQALQFLVICCKEIFLIQAWREPVKHPRLEKAAGSGVASGAADTVQNAALPVQQKEIGFVADGLQNEAALHPVAQFIQRLKAQRGHPLQGGLDDIQQPGSGHVLAQQHTEHGGLLRILQGEGGEVEPGVGRVGGQQQAHVARALGP